MRQVAAGLAQRDGLFERERRLARSSSTGTVSSRPNSFIKARSLALLIFMRRGLTFSVATSATGASSTSPSNLGFDVRHGRVVAHAFAFPGLGLASTLGGALAAPALGMASVSTSAPAALAGRTFGLFWGGLGGGGGIGVRGGLGLARGVFFRASAFFNTIGGFFGAAGALLWVWTRWTLLRLWRRGNGFFHRQLQQAADFLGLCTGMDNPSVKKGTQKKTRAPRKPAHGAIGLEPWRGTSGQDVWANIWGAVLAVVWAVTCVMGVEFTLVRRCCCRSCQSNLIIRFQSSDLEVWALRASVQGLQLQACFAGRADAAALGSVRRAATASVSCC